MCTVAIIALHGGASLERCIRAVLPQDPRCVVMLGADMGSAEDWASLLPGPVFVPGPPFAIPERRARALALATTEWVGLLEDSSIPEPGWIRSVARNHSDRQLGAMGGPVAIAPDLSTAQLALGCCEFGGFHPSLVHRYRSRSPVNRPHLGHAAFYVSRLPGNNLAYSKSALAASGVTGHSLVETDANAALLAHGLMLAIDRGMQTTYAPLDDRGANWLARVRHGRLYGATCARGAPASRRVMLLAKALLLPLVLLARSLPHMMRVAPPSRWFATAAIIAWLETAWACGEGLGVVLGPGDSATQWQ